MKNRILIIMILTTLASCSSTTARKSVTYSALAGCAAGGAGGYALSPEGERNKMANSALFCATGAIISGAVGYFLHKDNPSNKKLKKSIDQDDREVSYSVKSGHRTIEVTPKVKSLKAFRVTNDHLPEEIRKRLPRSRAIVQEVQEQRIKKDGETIIVSPHQIYIHSTEEP